MEVVVGAKVEVGTHTHNSISPASDSLFLPSLSGAWLARFNSEPSSRPHVCGRDTH